MTARKGESRVRELMARDVIAVQPDDPLSEAVALMYEHRVSAVPVIDKRRRCQGILSTTDLIRLVHTDAAGEVEPDELRELPRDLTRGGGTSSPLGRRQVADFMTKDVMTVTLEDTVLKAAQEMLRHRVHRLVVVDSQQHVIGILSTMDLLAAFAQD